MGKYAQAGIFKGSIKEFNQFLISEEEKGSVYIESQPIKGVGFYFVIRKVCAGAVEQNTKVGEIQ